MGQGDGKPSVSPAEAIPLFLALCLTLSLDTPVDSRHELVQALMGCVSLTVLRLQVAGEVEVSELPGTPNNTLQDKAENQEEELEHDKQVKAAQVPGLTSALQLLLSRDTAGCAAAGRVKNLPDLHEAMIQLSEAIEHFSSRCDEVRRLGKELKAVVDGETGSKTD